MRVIIGAAALSTLLVLQRLELVTARQLRDNSVVVETAEVLYVPEITLVRLLMLGYDQAGADLIWLRTIDYFTRHFLSDRRYDWLEKLLEDVRALDPDWRTPYHWAGTNVLYGRTFNDNNVRRSCRFYELALERFPDDHEAAFRLGINYFIEMRGRNAAERQRYREIGAGYLEMAANMPGAPANIKPLVASIYSKLGKNQLAVQYVTELYLKEEDPAKREWQRRRLERLQSKTDLRAIDEAFRSFERRRKATFDYLSAGLFMLLGEPAKIEVDDIPWRRLLPHTAIAALNPTQQEPSSERSE